MVLGKRLFASLSCGVLPRFSISLVPVSLLSASVFSSSLSYALIIQPVQVKSALGEPFYAEVALSDLGPVKLQDLSAGIASSEELADLGVKPGSYNGALSFSIQPVSADRGIIVIRGRQPVNEPFIDFVLQVKNGQNTRLKRVSAMIDPADNNKKVVNLQTDSQRPVQTSTATPISLATSSMPTMDVTASRPAPPSPERRLTVANALPPEMKAPQPAISPASPNKTATSKVAAAPKEIEVSTAPRKNQPRHVVRNNESLWKIAKQLEPQLKQPVGQIMQRIRDLNQDAFIAGNPNQLKRGASLILPEREQHTTLVTTPQPGALVKTTPKVPLPTVNAPVNRSGRLPKAELTLVAPNMQGNAQGNSTSGQNVGFQPLPREIVLKIGQERRKTVLMQHEVSELDAQLALNDKKIAMLNAKLAELEHQLKTRNQAKKLPAQKQPMQVLPPKKAANAILPIVAFAALSVFGFAPNMARAAEGDSGGGFPLWIIIAVAVVVIGAIAAKVLSGKSANKPAARGKKRPAPRRPASAAVKKEQPAARPVAPAPAEAPVPVARPVAQPAAADVLQEVQSYIERDRYSQAIGLLKDGIGKNPERVDLQVKLLEVYALQNDMDGFEQQFAIVRAFNQPETTQHAEKMRMLLQPKAAEDFSPVDDLSFDFHSSKPASASNNVIEFDAQSAPALAQEVDVPASAADQSLAELEAEFGFAQQPAAKSEAAIPATSFDLNLDDFDNTTQVQHQAKPVDFEPATAKAVPEDAPIDLEFDLNDSFILEEVKIPEPAPTTFNLELEPPRKAAAPIPPQVNLENLEVTDTNWADGFDDQDFNIGTATTPVPNATVTLTPADHAASPEDFLAKEFPFLVNLDVQQTNLELAESYINLGERASARELLGEVLNQGNPQQQAQAQHLMQKLAS